MVTRLLLATLLALSACGGAMNSGQDLRVSILVASAVGPVDSYRIRVFGAAVKCGEVLSSPATFELGATSVCAPAEIDTSSNCLVAFDVFAASSSDQPVNEIPAGQRTVFVEGLSGGSVAAHGCAAVTVAAGKSAAVSITLQ
jgi:hypothetical protein